MVYTLILFVSRKTGISLQTFKHHWESNHVPLLKSLVGRDFPLSHTRHYIDRDLDNPESPARVLFGQPRDFTFDAVAVFTFIDKSHWERFYNKAREPEVAKILLEDDEKFQDREKLRGVFVGDTKATGKDGGEAGWRFVGNF
ncbi:hypothetical protein K469DRAFT_557066 [Zopfia rhizophila CBS 207.26]|uniref:EthD domain-containing protein n=1 Tax=Zopfia rhizophila CBS 207.26 TaxID=1314779 RepID=A0A6A6EGE0_9PEZI|nr:hypothetical protein K469DRAFT_557066 [Zopfia rhizophila CBS 207.26]